MALVIALLLSGCTTTITTEGWTVSCNATAPDECSAVASVALNNMGRGRPVEPTGVITVTSRGSCAPVPEWADGSACFDAHVPIAPSEEVCLVIARRPTLGGYGQVGGDEVSGLAIPPGWAPLLSCQGRQGSDPGPAAGPVT